MLEATKKRPIVEVGRQPQQLPDDAKAGRSTWTYEALTTEVLNACHARGLERLNKQDDRKQRLERLGRERSILYLLAVSTGLRHNELCQLAIEQIHFDSVPRPYIELLAVQAKSGRGASLPLRVEIVAELRAYLAECGPVAPGAKLFRSPPTIRVFDGDLQAAGISKKDARGWVLDIHALRHTFGTHLSAVDVHPPHRDGGHASQPHRTGNELLH